MMCILVRQPYINKQFQGANSGFDIAGAPHHDSRMTVTEIDLTGYKMARCAGLEESSFVAVNQVLMGLTHAMSNILMPLREYPRLILSRLPEHSAAIPLLSNMEIAADRLCEVNNNLILLCHGNEGMPTRVNLVAIAQQVIAEVADQYPTEGSITVDLQTGSAPSVLDGPMDSLFHMIRNLCVNAYEAMRKGGTLSVAIEPVTVSKGNELNLCGIPPGSYHAIHIRDSGPGIDPLIKDKLFDPFVTTVRGEGRGLGLSQVYRTVRYLKGHILYNPDSTPGAAFLVLLPNVER